jgi:phenylacetate-CoA ligase
MNLERDVYSRSPIFLQTLFLNFKACELYLERYGNKFRKCFKEFEKNQWLSGSELRKVQDEKLRSLIQHAYKNVPYYYEIMSSRKLTPADIKTKEDLHKLPILTREHVKKHAEALISRTYPRKLLRHGHTSGTTGSPLDFHYDIQTCVAHLVAVWRQKYWAGMKYGDAIATFQGRVIVPLDQSKPPFWRKNYINNQLFFSSFHLHEKNLPYYFEKLEKDSP